MSERTVPSWILAVAVFVTGFSCGAIGYHDGERAGRDEQAKVDAAKGQNAPFYKSSGCEYGVVVDTKGTDLYTQVTGCDFTPGSDNRAFIERFEQSMNLHLLNPVPEWLPKAPPKRERKPAKPQPQAAPTKKEPGTWEELTIRVSYNWALGPDGNPVPELTYFCPAGWEVKAAYGYFDGKTVEGFDPPSCFFVGVPAKPPKDDTPTLKCDGPCKVYSWPLGSITTQDLPNFCPQGCMCSLGGTIEGCDTETVFPAESPKP